MIKENLVETGVILLTATITPNSFHTLTLKDPETRRCQYKEALDFYLRETSFRIVFIENSGESLQQYFLKDTQRIEFLTFTSNPNSEDRGKGFKELEILKYGMNNSEFIKSAKFIIKITGRLQVLNINILARKFIILYSRNKSLIYGGIYKTLKADSRCFIFTIDFWSFLNKRGKLINHSYSLERCLWDAISDYQKSKEGFFRHFRYPARIKGINAGYGTTYNHSRLRYFLKKARNCFRVPYYYNKLRKD